MESHSQQGDHVKETALEAFNTNPDEGNRSEEPKESSAENSEDKPISTEDEIQRNIAEASRTVGKSMW